MKYTLIAIFTFLFCSLIYTNTNAQELSREVGFRFSGLQSFGFFYKKEVDEKRFLRYRLGSVNIRSNILDNNNDFSSGAFFSFGVEDRTKIAEDLSFLHGPEGVLGVSFQSSKNSQTNNTANQYSISPTIGYVLGLLYDFNDKVFLGMEVIPGFGIIINGGSDRKTSGQLNFNASINTVSVLAGYRF